MIKKALKYQGIYLKYVKNILYTYKKSVFEGDITQLNYMKLKKELGVYIRKDKDSVITFTSRSEKWLDKDFWGIEDDKTSNFF